MKRLAAIVCTLAALVPLHAVAWGTRGHMMIGRVAAENFPADMPAFARSSESVEWISDLGPEEDVLKGSGESWDDDNDPGHYLDVGDDGTVDGVALGALPESMARFTSALEPYHATPWSVGYLPYSILDGFEQLRMDFALWRVDDYAARRASTAALRERFAGARAMREMMAVRDIGVWGHFVGDGSQPLHVTLHYNGWGTYPNPQGYTTEHIHSLFESDFVDRYVTIADVRAYVPALRTLSSDHLLSQRELASIVGSYLAGTNAAVVPLYRIAGATGSGFRTGSAGAISFTARQIARGAGELRDLTFLAWQNSAYASVGYPAHRVQDIVRGSVPITDDLLGD